YRSSAVRSQEGPFVVVVGPLMMPAHPALEKRRAVTDCYESVGAVTQATGMASDADLLQCVGDLLQVALVPRAQRFEKGLRNVVEAGTGLPEDPFARRRQCHQADTRIPG